MPDMLRQQLFVQDVLGEVAGFDCGNEPWSLAQSRWIRERALSSIDKFGTEVWLYYNEADDLVGFGSLGKTRRRFPPPDGNYEQLSIIPSLAIQKTHQGQPSEHPKYSRQIMLDLIAKSRLHGTNQLTLDVYQDNKRATAFYEKYGFVSLGDIQRSHTKMFLRLR